MAKLFEAGTVKNTIRAMMNSIREMLKDRTLPKSTVEHLEALNTDLKKNWADLENSGNEGDPTKSEAARRPFESDELPLTEAATVGVWLESRIHSMFTSMADDLYGQGYLTRDERKALSHGIGQALDAFITSVQTDAPQLYDRSPWAEPPEDDGGMMEEAAQGAQQDYQTRGGKKFRKEDFFYAKSGNPSEWALLKSGEPGAEPDAVHTGAAAAALGPNPPHGKGVKIPAADLPAVKKAVLAAWQKAHPEARADDKDYPSWLAEGEEEKESVIFESGLVPLVEKSVRTDGTVPVKIIQPGWGSSGYYPPEVLQRDGPKVFTSGTKMFLDHPTPQEEADRPERSLRDLAAELVNDARWSEDPTNGPGLYADAKVFDPFREAVDELASHIGVSIRAMGRAEMGQAEGKKGPIIQEITSARSVDFVTTPGAGGKICQILEARRALTERVHGAAQNQEGEPDGHPNTQQKGENNMGELEQLKESNAQLQKQLDEFKAAMARLQEGVLLREAGEFAARALMKSDLPMVTRERLAHSLVKLAPIKEGKLDTTGFQTLIEETVKAEVAYLAEATGSGQITGMGGGGSPEPKPEEQIASMKESWMAMGYSEATADKLAKGR